MQNDYCKQDQHIFNLNQKQQTIDNIIDIRQTSLNKLSIWHLNVNASSNNVIKSYLSFLNDSWSSVVMLFLDERKIGESCLDLQLQLKNYQLHFLQWHGHEKSEEKSGKIS